MGGDDLCVQAGAGGGLVVVGKEVTNGGYMLRRLKKWDRWTAFSALYVVLGFVYVLHDALGIPDALATILFFCLLVVGLFIGVAFL